MATPQAGQPIQAAQGDQLAQLANMLGTLFGTKQTQTTTANTAPLQQVLAQLQAQDPMQQLQSIFMQAGGAIPGLQTAYSNAVGARSGGNSAVQANLEKLLQQTALLGQQQVAQQQQQNLQTQMQAASGIAQGSQTTTAKTKGQAGGLAGMLALAQGAMKLTGSKDLEELWRKMGGPATGGAAGATTAAAAGPALASNSSPVSSAEPPQMSIAPFMQSGGVQQYLGAPASQEGVFTQDFLNALPEGGMSLAPWANESFQLFPSAPIDNFSPAPEGFIPQLDLMQYF